MIRKRIKKSSKTYNKNAMPFKIYRWRHHSSTVWRKKFFVRECKENNIPFKNAYLYRVSTNSQPSYNSGPLWSNILYITVSDIFVIERFKSDHPVSSQSDLIWEHVK